MCCLVQVLHIDRNNYYGGESASLNLQQVQSWMHAHECNSTACAGGPLLSQLLARHQKPSSPEALGACDCAMQLYERFRPGEAPPKALGPSRDYNVDMVPKFIMNSGELVGALRLLFLRCTCCWSARQRRAAVRKARLML